MSRASKHAIYVRFASWYVAVVASFGKRGRRFLAGAVVAVLLMVGACTPVMTTRYREVPLAWQGSRGETVRFELTDGSNVDMTERRVQLRLQDHTISGQSVSGGPARVDLRDVRRIGVSFEEKDEPATTIKYLALGSVGYAGVLIGFVIIAVLGQQ